MFDFVSCISRNKFASSAHYMDVTVNRIKKVNATLMLSLKTFYCRADSGVIYVFRFIFVDPANTGKNIFLKPIKLSLGNSLYIKK